MSKQEDLAKMFSEALFPGGDEIWSDEAKEVKKRLYASVLADIKSGALEMPEENEDENLWLTRSLKGILK
jgi:hypothetical protein